VGRCPIFCNETEVSASLFRDGDLLRIGQQLLFLLVRRPATMPAVDENYPSHSFGDPDPLGIVGESAAIWRLRAQISFFAAQTGHVLISGPSGTGKELVAQAIHALSSRKVHRLVSRNAATLPEALIDAELFGNAKNYPNLGMEDRPGLLTKQFPRW
jgi:two-component system nitrogen regulation response regulator GlnG/two-component system response regulator HydG